MHSTSSRIAAFAEKVSSIVPAGASLTIKRMASSERTSSGFCRSMPVAFATVTRLKCNVARRRWYWGLRNSFGLASSQAKRLAVRTKRLSFARYWRSETFRTASWRWADRTCKSSSSSATSFNISISGIVPCYFSDRVVQLYMPAQKNRQAFQPVD